MSMLPFRKRRERKGRAFWEDGRNVRAICEERHVKVQLL